MKKYLLCPGWLEPKGKSREFITAPELVRLYGICRCACMVELPNLKAAYPGLIRLEPRADGDYTLPKAATV